MAVAYALGMRSDTDYARRVGMALSAIRDYLDLSQMDVATAAGTSAATISRYEDGRSAAQAETLVRIARALDVPLDLLLDPPATRQDVFELLALHRAKRRADAGRN